MLWLRFVAFEEQSISYPPVNEANSNIFWNIMMSNQHWGEYDISINHILSKLNVL